MRPKDQVLYKLRAFQINAIPESILGDFYVIVFENTGQCCTRALADLRKYATDV